ncbi:MAG: hypothetical protein WC701_13160, partial [Kiritimatiellales bacterium]
SHAGREVFLPFSAFRSSSLPVIKFSPCWFVLDGLECTPRYPHGIEGIFNSYDDLADTPAKSAKSSL